MKKRHAYILSFSEVGICLITKQNMLINNNPHLRVPFIFRGHEIKFFYWKRIYVFSDTFPKFFVNHFLNIYAVSCILFPGSFYTLLLYKLIFASPPWAPTLSICVYTFHYNGPRGSIMVHLVDNPCFKFSKYMGGIISYHCTALHFKKYLNTYLPA